MAPSSRHLYPEWLRPRSARVDAQPATPREQQDDGAWRVWQWLRAFDRRYATLVDLVLAAGLFVLCSGWFVERTAPRPSLWFVAALIFPLVFRRRAPMTVFLVIAAVAFVQWLVAEPALADAALLVALYTVALESEWRLVAAATAILEVGVVMATVALGPDPQRRSRASSSSPASSSRRCWPGWWCAPCAASSTGWPSGRQRLELERDQQATLAAVTERARIAREMHDVVSHNIQVMVTLADAASLAQATDPARAAEAMDEVSSTGRQALTDMRRMLGVLRDEPVPAGPDDPPPATAALSATPPPGTAAAIPRWRPNRACVSSRRSSSASGAPGSTSRSGAWACPSSVSGAAGLTVYRVVQEALTNALKHAEEATSVEIELAFADPDIAVRVTDDGRSTGHCPGRSDERRPRPGRHGGTGHRVRGHAQRRTTPRRRLGGRGQAARLQGPHAGMTIRVVLADDQALLRKGFRMILEAEEDMEIVGEAADGTDAVRLVELYRPDVVLMDVRMPVLDGIEATRAITSSEAGDEHPRPDPHDLRPRRVRLQRAAGGRQRVPPQGRPPGGARERHPHRGPRRRRRVAPHHPPPARGVRRDAAGPQRGRPRGRTTTGRRSTLRWPA